MVKLAGACRGANELIDETLAVSPSECFCTLHRRCYHSKARRLGGFVAKCLGYLMTKSPEDEFVAGAGLHGQKCQRRYQNLK